MNKTALKNFAIEARKELLERITTKAMQLGITEESIEKADIASSNTIFINGKQLVDHEIIQRNKLINRIKEIGFERVIDEVAYTWFNRFTALRFMEVNDYLPTRTRVLSSEGNPNGEPDMMKEALTLDLELDKELVYELMVNNESDELFKYLIKAHCNDLNRYMPFMFETIEDYTAILFPDGLLAPDSFLRRMTDTDVIPEDNWEAIEVIGWLYQYYIAEENERVIQAKKRYKSEEIPFATQLFTPEWIVRYMVQNALGRYWIESHPEQRDLIDNWEYYLENPNPEEDFEEKLTPYINKELKVEDIKCFDPAMGSGHILVYMFDVLHEIYSKSGYMEREIPRLIIENNLYGLDIDDRAFQLASFSVVMKAAQYDKRFLRTIERDGLKLNLASIQETNSLTDEDIAFLAGEETGENFEKMSAFLNQFKHAKAIGSLIKIKSHDAEFIQERIEVIEQHSDDLFTLEMKDRILSLFKELIKQVSIMNQQYDVFITNPPYAGNRYMTTETSSYIGKNYPDVKSDLFSAFMEYSFYATKKDGQMGFITPYVWMFISSYGKIRNKIVEEKNISSLVQLEYNGFEAAMVPVCLFTMRNYQANVTGEYIKLSDFKGIENQPIRALEAVQNPSVPYRYTSEQKSFGEIAGSPIAYWISSQVVEIFEQGTPLEQIALPKQGMATCDNDRFLRFWFEIGHNRIKFNAKNAQEGVNSKLKWFPYHKGGTFRRWSGNVEYVVNWENNGEEIREYTNMLNKEKPGGRIKNEKFYFMKGLTWSALTSGSISFRYFEEGFLFDTKGSVCFPVKSEDIYYLAGLLNSNVVNSLMKVLAPTLDFNPLAIRRIPYFYDDLMNPQIKEKVKKSILISENDWNNYEVSWGFKKHQILMTRIETSKVELAYDSTKLINESKFNELRQYEEELNRIFIEIYGLQEELSPEVDEKDITIRKADLERDIKSFISYAIGCSFGRYSLDEDGLIYAGGEFDPKRYETFKVDEDNILPILPGTYFEDDIVSRFVEFVRVTFGEESLSENLDFVADALTRRKNETARETLRRYFMNDFYKDHVQIYKKRPIYWQFTSGKEKAFNCLIYMHRYDKTTLSRIRTDYLHEYQVRLDTEKIDLMNVIEGDTTTKEINDAKRELNSLEKKIVELKKYDEVLHHMADMQIEIDLDDGVKVNYEKFKGLVTKI